MEQLVRIIFGKKENAESVSQGVDLVLKDEIICKVRENQKQTRW